jgi:hypothetical protein
MPILDHLIKPQQDSGHSEAPLANAFQNAPVLLVEDEPDMAAEVTKELANLGYHVRNRSGGACCGPQPSGRTYDRRSHAQGDR